MADVTEAKQIEQLTQLGLEPKVVGDGSPFVTLPTDARVHDLEGLLPAPKRVKQTVQFRTVESFIQYSKKWMTKASMFWADISLQNVVFGACYDYHDLSSPSWCSHNARYDVVLSEEWKAWLAYNNKAISQEKFAEFLEDRAGEVVTPDAATMREIAYTLEAKKSVTFRSGVRLDNGDQQITFEEDTKSKAGKDGTLEIPRYFTVEIPVFYQGEKQIFPIKLSYRIGGAGELTFTYSIERTDKIIDLAARDTAKKLNADLQCFVHDTQQFGGAKASQ